MTQRIKRVLDKLYNLKGEHNFVIAEIVENIEKAEAAITNATEEQNSNEIKKSDVIGKLTVFNNQKDTFLSAFSDLDDDTFSALRDIDVNANFGTMISIINDKSPEYCEELNKEIDNYDNLIKEAKQTVADNAKLVAELEDNKRTEEEKRNKLVSLLEQSLSTEEIEREALSTSYVKKIISAFDLFSEEEVVSLAKIIMFPEDGLIEYNESYDEESAANFNINEEEPEEPSPEPELDSVVEPEPVEEPVKEEQTVEAPIIEEEPTVETPVAEPELDSAIEEPSEEAQRAEELYQNVISSPEVTDIIEKHGDTTEINLKSLNMDDTEEEQNDNSSIEETVNISEDEVEEFINSINLDSTQVTPELKKLLASSDHKSVEENFEILRSEYISDEAIYRVVDNHNYLTDQDLNKKITLLRAKGISELKIKSFLEKENSHLRLNLDEFGKCLEIVESNDGKLTDENVYKIDLDTKTYEANKKALADAGYDIEEKEERNYNSVIYSSPYLPNDIKVLKEYLISIIKRNSKYALSVFWKNPTELTTDIDDIIEAGLENIIETNPEVLEENNSELIKRVKYCQESGHQIYVGEDSDAYCDYITSYAAFQEKIGNIQDLPELETRKNSDISNLFNEGNKEFVSTLVSELDKYYENPQEYPKFDDNIIEKVENIKLNAFTSINIEDAGKYTYKIKDISLSKNKITRNLSIIVAALKENNKSYEGLEKELVTTAVLYNLRADLETMKNIANECLNQGGNN